LRCAGQGYGPTVASRSTRSGTGYASLLISEGLDVLFVSRQLGHANPNVTLEVYAHEFARREHGARARVALETAYAEMVAAGRR
jgi:integrase